MDIKIVWLKSIKTGTWILSIVSTFLITPPLIGLKEETTIKPVVRFIIASIVALSFIPMQRFSKKKYYGPWFKFSISSFVLAGIIVTFYFVCIDNWGADYYGKTLVKGEHMFKEAVAAKKAAADKLNRTEIDDDTFIKTREGQTQYIWPLLEIKHRFYILISLYILSTVLLSFFIISVAQAIHCYQSKL